MILNKAEHRRRLTMLTGLLAAGHVAMAQSISASSALQSADSMVSNIKEVTFHLAAGIIGLIGVVLLVWQGAKYLKGDPNTKDALLVFAGGIIIIAVLMEVLKAIF